MTLYPVCATVIQLTDIWFLPEADGCSIFTKTTVIVFLVEYFRLRINTLIFVDNTVRWFQPLVSATLCR